MQTLECEWVQSVMHVSHACSIHFISTTKNAMLARKYADITTRQAGEEEREREKEKEKRKRKRENASESPRERSLHWCRCKLWCYLP